MLNFIINLVLKFATSKVAEELISVGINKLLKATNSGIGNKLAETMINGVVASKRNPTTDKVFKDAICLLK
jgi:hypothetical protein